MKFYIFLLFLPIFQKCNYNSDGTTGKLGSGYHIFLGNTTEILGKKNIVLIKEIDNYENGDSFIIANRNIHKMIEPLDSSDIHWLKQNKSDSIQFWIIDKNIDSSYGPLNKAEYLELKKDLKVPNSLKLNLEEH